VRAEAAPRRGRTRGRARVWLEVGDGPDGWGPLGGGGEGEESAAELGWERGGDAVGPCGGGKRKGWMGCGEKKRKGGGREEKWAGPKEKKGEKKKIIQKHLNLNLNLKFKFKLKTSNKTMQCGMKYTRPIFSYISFYD
jgi:hypothetical protein